MIYSNNCMNVILMRHPGFQSTWEQHMSWWAPDIPGICNNMNALLDYAVSLINRDRNQEMEMLLALIEELIVEGDNEVSTAVTTCFLEGLLNMESNGNIEASAFNSMLRAKSLEFCRFYNEYTGVDTPGL